MTDGRQFSPRVRSFYQLCFLLAGDELPPLRRDKPTRLARFREGSLNISTSGIKRNCPLLSHNSRVGFGKMGALVLFAGVSAYGCKRPTADLLPQASDRNVLLITIDTLRGDALSDLFSIPLCHRGDHDVEQAAGGGGRVDRLRA